MGADREQILSRPKAMDIVVKLANCGLGRKDKWIDEGNVTATDIAMSIGFEQGLKFSAENPEYAMALYRGVRNTGMKERQWRRIASEEYRQVMEQYPITSSIGEDEFIRRMDGIRED